jgi:prepilin signal peptidase PulO-like enzyme (type II secretory pathway)
LAVVGAFFGLLIILIIDQQRMTGPSYILPAVLVGALIGGVYGFLRNRV